MQKKKIFAMLLSAMIVMSASAVSVFADEPEQGNEEPGATHSHVWSEWSTTVEPTCTTTGTATRTCAGEGECDATSELTTQTLDALGHDWSDWVDGVKTCKNGCGAEETCSHASKTTATCTTPSTCNECKMTFGEVDSDAHNYTGNYTPDESGNTHSKACANDGCDAKDTQPCDNTAESDCTGCGRKATGPAECTHTNTEATPNGDGKTHNVVCADDNCGATVTENVTCTDNGDGTCVCGRTMASQDPGEEKTAITEVNLGMDNFEVGGTLPTVRAEEANVNYTIDYKWFKNGKEVSDLATIEADKYTCQITLTAKENYTFKGLTIANFPGFTKQPTQPLTVSEDGSEATTSVTIDKSDKKEESGSGSTGGSSSSSSTTNPSVNADAEADKIKGAEAGQKVEVKIDGNTVPASYVQAALSSKATIVVDYGTYAWEISDVKQVKAVDLSINTSARYLVEQGALKGLKGDNSNVIDIAHDGNLGFKGTLKYNVRKANAGKYVNLYFYNTKTKKLELQGSTKIGSDGYVLLPFTHCSTYVLNITATPASNELFEDFSAGESATVVEDTLPAATNAPAATEAPATTDAAANPETGNSAAALMAIPMAIAAAAIISKKR